MKIPVSSAITIVALAIGAILYNGNAILAMTGHAMTHPKAVAQPKTVDPDHDGDADQPASPIEAGARAAKPNGVPTCLTACSVQTATAVAKGNGAKAVAENHITNNVTIKQAAPPTQTKVINHTRVITRKVVVPAQTRTVVVQARTRTVTVPAHTRTVVVAAQTSPTQTPAPAPNPAPMVSATLPATGAGLSTAVGVAALTGAGLLYIRSRRS